MRTVGALEAKGRLSQLLVEVDQAGEPVLTQRRGRSVAVRQPYQGYAEGSRAQDADRAVHATQAEACALYTTDRDLLLLAARLPGIRAVHDYPAGA